jgi:hypothetical protein
MSTYARRSQCFAALSGCSILSSTKKLVLMPGF